MLRKFWSKDGRSAIAYPDWPILASFPTIFLFIIFALSHVGSHVNLAKFWLFSRFSSTFPALESAEKFQNKIIYISKLSIEDYKNFAWKSGLLKTDYNCKVRKQYVKQWVEMFFEVALKFSNLSVSWRISKNWKRSISWNWKWKIIRMFKKIYPKAQGLKF